MVASETTDRQILIGPGCAAVPERLLLAHSQGKVLFITGAGSSAPANLPNFRQLVLKTYEKIDSGAHAIFKKVPPSGRLGNLSTSSLTAKQKAELNQYCKAYYDVVLGMLERRIDGPGSVDVTVRTTISDILREAGGSAAPIHKALVRLADRGAATSIATTNFDLLLERAAKNIGVVMESYALGAIPRPSRSARFRGVFHIHGALDPKGDRTFDFVVSDQDFGEYYLRRRTVPDFIYDAARLFNIVLVGYSANDPPMRYLLNAVAADGSRFEDFKERFAFVGGAATHDEVATEEWLGRGITPISYDDADHHIALRKTLERWAALSAINGKPAEIDRLVRRLVKRPRNATPDHDRDLMDHLIRRADPNERLRLTSLMSKLGASMDWLTAIKEITLQRRRLAE